MKNTCSIVTETFGRKWWASGAMGFGGEGYSYHKPIWPLLHKEEITFVGKTITWDPRLTPAKGLGNMPLKSNFTPSELLPKSIYITPQTWLGGYCLNAVGLSNPGTEIAFEEFGWQSRRKPFMISFMPMGDTSEKRLQDVRLFVGALGTYVDSFQTKIAVQLNESCPNTGHDLAIIGQEILSHLDCFTTLGIPVIVKVNALFPIELACGIAKHPACFGLSPTNTVPFGQGKYWINWKKLFGTERPEESPLALRFPRKPDGSVDTTKAGGLSGRPIGPIVRDWIRNARHAGIVCHINGGGGILSAEDAAEMFRAGADSISLGTIVMLRPWHIEGCIHMSI